MLWDSMNRILGIENFNEVFFEKVLDKQIKDKTWRPK